MGPWAKHLRARPVYTRIDRINRRGARLHPFPLQLTRITLGALPLFPRTYAVVVNRFRSSFFYGSLYTGLRRDRARGI